jgi:hypothetical protein
MYYITHDVLVISVNSIKNLSGPLKNKTLDPTVIIFIKTLSAFTNLNCELEDMIRSNIYCLTNFRMKKTTTKTG